MTTACLFALLLFAALVVKAQDPPSRAYQLKAAFLFNFTLFVEWPQQVFSSRTDPFIIGILGANPFGNYLQEVVNGESWKGHPILVKTFSHPREATDSHILFITAGAWGMNYFKNRPVLTVSDKDDFVNQNGIIEFFTEDNKIRMRINNRAARNAQLTISSKLLRLAEVKDYR